MFFFVFVLTSFITVTGILTSITALPELPTSDHEEISYATCPANECGKKRGAALNWIFLDLQSTL
jgi:hypothetical protein